MFLFEQYSWFYAINNACMLMKYSYLFLSRPEVSSDMSADQTFLAET